MESGPGTRAAVIERSRVLLNFWKAEKPDYNIQVNEKCLELKGDI